MRWRCLIGLGLALGLAGCGKDRAVTAPVTAGTVDKDGVRHVAITADQQGYTPSRILGKPGEKLDLVFTRRVAADCLSKIKTPDGKLVELPLDTPVDVAVTVPPSGELAFACGMDMYRGAVVAQP